MSMIEEISEGVKISVEAFFQPEYSNPKLNECMFAYKIFITNNNPFPIQLLSRHWFIFDSVGTKREVQGDGVVGEQPIILSGKSYHYTSGCNLQSEMGRMHGTYQLENLHTKKMFTVSIPVFEMVADYKLN